MLNKDTVTVLSLFPTPVFTAVYTDGDLEETIKFFDSCKMEDHGKTNQYGLVSKDTYILDNPKCKPLTNFIIESVSHFANEILLYDYKEYCFTQSWISHKLPGQAHTTHIHANSLISGVFYYGEQDDMPAITFHKMMGGINSSFISPLYQRDRRKSEYAWEVFNITYSQGLLLLFPSYLLHSVPVNESKKIRKSIAFNIMPKEKLGDEETLTELLFQRVI